MTCRIQTTELYVAQHPHCARQDTNTVSKSSGLSWIIFLLTWAIYADTHCSRSSTKHQPYSSHNHHNSIHHIQLPTTNQQLITTKPAIMCILYAHVYDNCQCTYYDPVIICPRSISIGYYCLSKQDRQVFHPERCSSCQMLGRQTVADGKQTPPRTAARCKYGGKILWGRDGSADCEEYLYGDRSCRCGGPFRQMTNFT